jgi:phage shock protein PspC (stress-responsive transcriptional regulator)
MNISIKNINYNMLSRKEPAMIAGVCQGLAHNMGMDPSIVRIVFAILLLCTPFPIGIIYIIMAIILPEVR